MKCYVKLLDKAAKWPVYATDGAACADLHAVRIYGVTPRTITYGTGLAFALDPGTAMFIYSRSGDGFSRGIRLANCVGVIDSDYRGEVLVKVRHDNLLRGLAAWAFLKLLPKSRWVALAAGRRIAQAAIMPVERCEFVRAHELGETTRGAGGFGSTGQ